MSSTSAEAFERVRARIKATLGTDRYTSWFGRMKLQDKNGAVIVHSVPTAFLKNWIKSHYADLILQLWQEEDGSVQAVEFVLRDATRVQSTPSARRSAPPASEARSTPDQRSPAANDTPGAPSPAGDNRAAERSTSQRPKRDGGKPSVLGSPLDPRFTFETFIEGASNRVALAAARSVAEVEASSIRFNPLFIHASVGFGKTHLLQAIAGAAIAQSPQKKIVYLTAEYFMWRFATAIRDNDALTLKEQLHGIDLLIIDDMQFLQGKTIQREFCHLLNSLLDSARQVVVAADRPASELESLEDRVRSRLTGGVMFQMNGPDYEMRRNMLQRRLVLARKEDPNVSISDSVLDHVAQVVTGSGRELEGAFNQLLFRQSFEPDMSVEKVDEFLGHIYRGGEPKRVRIEDIQRVVARHYNVSKSELLSNRRTRTIVKPRQVAMYLSKMLTPRSLPEIGRRFGGRDHTTVLHAIRKIGEATESDLTLAQEVELLKRLINEQG